MKRPPKSFAVLFAVMFVLGGLSVTTASPACAQGQAQTQAQGSVRSRAEETLEWWNHIGNRLIAMAKDFPEDKYDFKEQKDERTFAQIFLQVAAVDYDLISRVAGSQIGPDFGRTVTARLARCMKRRRMW